MAREGRKKAERAIADTLSAKANKPDLVPALVGAYINGQKTLVVVNRPDFLWVRLRGNTSEPVKAFNGENGVGPQWDLPILVYRDEVDSNIWKVFGRDNRVYQTWSTPGGQPISYLPRHGYTHSFGGSGSIGADVAWIYKRQWMPLLPRPNATGTMAIYVEPGFYFCGDQYHYWPGSGTTSFSGSKPTGAFNGRFVTTYLDCASETLAYINGPEINTYSPPPDPGDHIAVPAVGAGVPLAAVWLVTGTDSIGWFDIYDLRATEHVQPTGTAGLLQGVYKQGDQEVTNAVPVDDSELSLVLAANNKYHFEFNLFLQNDNAAEGYRVGNGGLVGFSDLKAQVFIYDDTLNSLAGFARLTATGTSIAAGLSSGANYAEVRGSVRTTVEGTLKVQFAQNVAGGSAGVHHQSGSSLIVTQLE